MLSFTLSIMIKFCSPREITVPFVIPPRLISSKSLDTASSTVSTKLAIPSPSESEATTLIAKSFMDILDALSIAIQLANVNPSGSAAPGVGIHITSVNSKSVPSGISKSNNKSDRSGNVEAFLSSGTIVS